MNSSGIFRKKIDKLASTIVVNTYKVIKYTRLCLYICKVYFYNNSTIIFPIGMLLDLLISFLLRGVN